MCKIPAMLVDCLRPATDCSTFPTHFVRLGTLIADNMDLKLRLPGIPHARSLILISQPRKTPCDASTHCAVPWWRAATDNQTYRNKLFTDIISFHSVRLGVRLLLGSLWVSRNSVGCQLARTTFQRFKICNL